MLRMVALYPTPSPYTSASQAHQAGDQARASQAMAASRMLEQVVFSITPRRQATKRTQVIRQVRPITHSLIIRTMEVETTRWRVNRSPTNMCRTLKCMHQLQTMGATSRMV